MPEEQSERDTPCRVNHEQVAEDVDQLGIMNARLQRSMGQLRPDRRGRKTDTYGDVLSLEDALHRGRVVGIIGCDASRGEDDEGGMGDVERPRKLLFDSGGEVRGEAAEHTLDSSEVFTIAGYVRIEEVA